MRTIQVETVHLANGAGKIEAIRDIDAVHQLQEENDSLCSLLHQICGAVGGSPSFDVLPERVASLAAFHSRWTNPDEGQAMLTLRFTHPLGTQFNDAEDPAEVVRKSATWVFPHFQQFLAPGKEAILEATVAGGPHRYKITSFHSPAQGWHTTTGGFR